MSSTAPKIRFHCLSLGIFVLLSVIVFAPSHPEIIGNIPCSSEKQCPPINCFKAPCYQYQCIEGRCSQCLNGKCTPSSGQIACSNDGGVWKEFSNGCADNCNSQIPGVRHMCTQAFTKSCDCGSEKCWDGTRCVPNPQPPSTDDGRSFLEIIEAWLLKRCR